MTATSQQKSPKTRRASQANVFSLARKTRQLVPDLGEADSSLLTTVLAKSHDEEKDASGQAVNTGEQARPYSFEKIKQLVIHNPHHSTCVQAKVMSTTGLGHEGDKVDDALDPLCWQSWQATMTQIDLDLESTANAYLEVVRAPGSIDSTGEITGVYFIPTEDVDIYVENSGYDIHFELNIRDGARAAGMDSSRRKMAKFGDLRSFRERHGIPEGTEISEVIHFAIPSNLHRFYGFVDWLASVAYIELVQAMVQHQFDFHLNRGVPEFMLFLTGAKIDPKQWRKIEESIDAGIGLGNSHKSIAINIANPSLKITLEKLALEGTQDGAFFRDMMESLSMSIVSAHRVPPSIAGILIPGKMGASNEVSNALMAFQALVIGPRQKIFTTILNRTLGNPTFNGALGLTKGDFAFRTITDEMAEAMEKLKSLDTMGGMKQGLAEAGAEGRDLEAGLKKSKDFSDAKDFLAGVIRRLRDR